MKRRKSLIIFLILGLSSLFLAGLLVIAPKARVKMDVNNDLFIFDVRIDSPRTVRENGEIILADHVRIKNPTDKDCDLTGYYLSDSREKYGKFSLAGRSISAGGDVLITLDPSVNFALHEGEHVYLSDDKGNLIFEYSPDMKPEEPQVSADSGFYDEEFDALITGGQEYTIHYSLDGSIPTEDSPVYDGPIRVYDRSNEPNSVVNVVNTIREYNDTIHVELDDGRHVEVEQPKNEELVDKAFIIRAAAFDSYGNSSDVVTREYFFDRGKYKGVISVVADPEDLFGEYGILSVGKEYDDWYLGDKDGEPPEVNFDKKGREWEVPASMAYFRGEDEVLSQKCGLKLFGRTSRNNRLKNFQLCARQSYSGSDEFMYDFFEGEIYRPDRIMLDDSFTEAFFFSLVSDVDIIKHKMTDRVALFVNGEHWNDIYIKEKLDEKYFFDHFGIMPENLVVLNDTFPETGWVNTEEYEQCREMYAEVDRFAEENDLSIPENYQMISGMMDMGTYIDYLAINTWVGNGDWDEFTNSCCWRVKSPYDEDLGDGRFRWMLHDADYIFKDVVSLSAPEFIDACPLLKSLLKNDDFRKALSDRIIELGKTTFSDDRVENALSDPKWDEPEKQEIAEFFKTRKGTMDDLAQRLLTGE